MLNPCRGHQVTYASGQCCCQHCATNTLVGSGVSLFEWIHCIPVKVKNEDKPMMVLNRPITVFTGCTDAAQLVSKSHGVGFQKGLWSQRTSGIDLTQKLRSHFRVTDLRGLGKTA